MKGFMTMQNIVKMGPQISGAKDFKKTINSVATKRLTWQMIKLSSNFAHYTRINSNCNRYLKLTKQNRMKEMLEENMSAFFYHLGVRNSLLGTQNRQTTENFDMFLLCKDNKTLLLHW